MLVPSFKFVIFFVSNNLGRNVGAEVGDNCHNDNVLVLEGATH